MKKIIFIFLLGVHNICSQTITLDTNSILIGQQIELKISNEIQNTDVWPTYTDTIIKGVEIIKNSNIDTNKGIIYQTFTVTCWDSGNYHIPPIQFSKESKTHEILLNVSYPPIKEVDKLKDIKQPMNAPFSWSDIWPWLIIIISLIIILIIIRKYILFKKEKTPFIAPIETIPSDITALKKLNKLEEAKIWQAGDIKIYYSELSEIIRRYIEEQFRFIALELTTDEIIHNLNGKISIEEIKNIQLLLQRSDLAKFAKSKPIDTENSESMQLAKNFVIATRKTKNE